MGKDSMLLIFVHNFTILLLLFQIERYIGDVLNLKCILLVKNKNVMLFHEH
jgi:hypothetical protein